MSDHAIDRVIERFEFAGKHNGSAEIRSAAEEAIRSMWAEASYISDDKDGVLLRNLEFQCDFIVKNKVIRTLFPTKGAQLQPGNASTQELRMLYVNKSRFRQSHNRHK